MSSLWIFLCQPIAIQIQESRAKIPIDLRAGKKEKPNLLKPKKVIGKNAGESWKRSEINKSATHDARINGKERFWSSNSHRLKIWNFPFIGKKKSIAKYRWSNQGEIGLDS